MAVTTITKVGAFSDDLAKQLNDNFTAVGIGGTFASPTVTGTVAGAATYTTPTLTTPVVTTGLTASGSASNDFSASTGTFKTSSGANQLSGAVTISDTVTPSLTTAAGSTNTGFLLVNGKTSGSVKLTTADATAQAVTLSVAAQTVGAATISIPNQTGVNSSLVSAIGANYRIATGSTAFDGSNPTTVATGLTTVVGFVATMVRNSAVSSGTAFCTHAAPSGANVDVYAWLQTGAASTGTENFDWIAFGT